MTFCLWFNIKPTVSYKLKRANLTPYILLIEHFTTKQFKSTTIYLLFYKVTPKLMLHALLTLSPIRPEKNLQLTLA